MKTHVPAADKPILRYPSLAPMQTRLVQRKCACGNHTVAGGECAECSKNKQTLQRASLSPRGRGIEGEGEVSPIIHEVLRSPGQPLDPVTRAFMEPRFGHDFSQVRVHTDAKAAESARAVNALAYAVGRDVVFGAGQYAPGENQGKRLLAHELAHVVQQSSVESHIGVQRLGDSEAWYEQEAEAIAAQVTTAAPLLAIRPSVSPIGSASLAIMRAPEDKPGSETKARKSTDWDKLAPDAQEVLDYSFLTRTNHPKERIWKDHSTAAECFNSLDGAKKQAFNDIYTALSQVGLWIWVGRVSDIFPKNTEGIKFKPDPKEFLVQKLESSMRFCHVGKTDWRQMVTLGTPGLHIIVPKAGLCTAHIDTISPVKERTSDGECKYSLSITGARHVWKDLLGH